MTNSEEIFVKFRNEFHVFFGSIVHVFPALPSSLHIFQAVVAILLLFILHKVFFSPLNRVRDLTDVGYNYLKDDAKRRGMKLRDLVNQVRNQRKVGELPPVYANGWFALTESRGLKKGQVLPVSALGEHFVVFRTKEGEPYILDAYCPHLGAHLGVGGRVIGNCIECPFHGWQFDGRNGQCAAVPYSDKVPSFAKVKKWPTFEANGFVFVWYHAENIEPTWYPPIIKQVEEKQWSYRGRTEHYVNCCTQEISENGGDVAHLAQLHQSAIVGGVDLNTMRSKLWDFAEHVWEASWQENPQPEGHIATLSLTHALKILKKIHLFSVNVKAYQIGPSLVHLEFDTPFGNAVLIQTVTPLAPLHLRIIHQFYTVKAMPPPYSKLILLGEAIMIERDMMVWNNKTYISKPLLVKEDRLLAKHRRWYSQFFSENSPKLKFSKDTTEW